jgi:hypothetical protein
VKGIYYCYYNASSGVSPSLMISENKRPVLTTNNQLPNAKTRPSSSARYSRDIKLRGLPRGDSMHAQVLRSAYEGAGKGEERRKRREQGYTSVKPGEVPQLVRVSAIKSNSWTTSRNFQSWFKGRYHQRDEKYGFRKYQYLPKSPR